MNDFLWIGLGGFVATMLVNAVALLVFNKPEANFFTGDWWSSWFACYTVWIGFTIAGVAQKIREKGKKKS